MKKKSINQLDESEIEKLKQKQMKEINRKEKSAKEILKEVKKHGDSAVTRFTKKFDDIELEENELEVTNKEIKNAYEKISEESTHALKRAAEDIAIFHSDFVPSDLQISEYIEGINLGYKITPIEEVGCYVPGGKAKYPSSALMTIIPARIAGVDEIIVTTPPNSEGIVDPYTLVACDIAGANKVYKVGGVQAIASLAYGTKTIEKTQKIVGPGGAYVTAAKKLVSSEVDIDMVAGPSEITIIADESSDPETVAMDLLAQAEHGPDSISMLLTTSEKVAKDVEKTLESEMNQVKRKELTKKSLERSLIITGDKESLFELSNQIAPEHLEINTKCPRSDLDFVRNAGAIFLGKYSPVAIGDYATGCNHVLPTAGLAKTKSALSVDDFLKKSSVQHLTKQGLSRIRDIGEKIAEIEDLSSHKKSIESRFWEEDKDE